MKRVLKFFLSRVPIFLRLSQTFAFRSLVKFEKNSKNLDLGCGDGWITSNIKRNKSAIVNYVDWKKSDYSFFPQNDFIESDIYNVPLKDSSIDTVILSSVLQVVDDDNRLILEIKRLLKDKGNIILSVPLGYPLINQLLNIKVLNKEKISYESFKNLTNKRFNIIGKGFYKKNEIEDFLTDNGFRILESKMIPGHLVSIIFQILLYLRFKFNYRNLTSKLDIIFSPLILVDKLFSRSDNCIEIVIKAEKME